MKKMFLQFLWIVLLAVTSFTTTAQKVGIGTKAPNAALEVSSTTNGFLAPRLTIAQRNAIVNPATGLIIYCTECHEYEAFNGIVWKNMAGSAVCVLPTLKICEQVWMPKNLDVSKYRNGDIIPQVTDSVIWTGLTTGAWCWYNNDSATYSATYGKLYNWYAVNDPRGLAPAGWHIPSDSDWKILTTCLGGDAVAGGKLKGAGTNFWKSPNTGATNSTGFTALPAGLRYSFSVVSYFMYIGSVANFWSSTEYTDFGSRGSAQELDCINASCLRGAFDKYVGLSVRCVKD